MCSPFRRKSLQQKLQSLASTPFFIYVHEDDLELLARCFAVHRFTSGQTLPESPFYVLVRGELGIVDKKSQHTLCTKQAGAFFSRRAGLVEGSAAGWPRSEAAFALLRHSAYRYA